jgi:tryptophanyl-tRNA synthetase
LENEFAGKGYGDFKGAVAEVVTSYFAPVREKTQELLADEKALLELLAVGSEKARAVASQTLAKTYSALGLVPPRR